MRRRGAASDDGRMTVVEHLRELRFRLLVSLVAFGVAAVVAYGFYEPILRILIAPLGSGSRIGGVRVEGLQVPGIATAFVLRLKVSAYAGLLFALPVIVWQLWRFVAPGLLGREKRYAIPFVFSSVALFAGGAFVAYSVLPNAIGFLLGFTRAPGLEPLIFVDKYFSFVLAMMLVFAISFEFPVFLVSLGAMGLVPSARLRSWRRAALFVAFVSGAVLTPSGDPLSMMLLAVPLYLLYEVSIVLIRFGLKK